METRLFKTTKEDIEKAAEIIASGGIVAFPTETVYGLGADALNEDAVAAVYEAKGRPGDNPMIVHISCEEDLGKLTDQTGPIIRSVLENIWPGPLTIIVPKKPEVPDRTTGGLDTVAIRMPASEPALQLIEMCGCPIAAPSANLSGKPSPTRAKDVIADMDGRIDAIICGEDCRVGIESTVLDLTGEKATVLRPGIITARELETMLGVEVCYDRSLSEHPAAADIDPAQAPTGDDAQDYKPKSPGMKYRHYAPKAEMMIVSGSRDKVEAEVQRLRDINEKEGKKTGLILFGEEAFDEAAHDFFARLRDLDEEGVDLILAGAVSDSDEVGFAVMNRMLKSAGYRIVRV